MARRLIGTAVTDANGEATITYTGTGAGKLDVVAESGTFVSEPYEVLDCTFLDIATTGKKNSNWNKGSALTVSDPSDEGTTFSASSSTLNSGRYIATTGLTGDFRVEFEMKSSYGVRFGVTNSTANMTSSTYFMTLSEYTEFREWKIECINGVLTAYIFHNGAWESLTMSGDSADTSSTLYFAFAISASGTTYTGVYRNLKIYPI